MADAHVLAPEALIENSGRPLTMNCGHGRGFPALDGHDAMDHATNTPIQRVLQGRRPSDPDSLISDNSRIKATPPWVPRHADLDTIMAHALAPAEVPTHG